MLCSGSSRPLADAGAASCCSDLREMNEAKVANIIAYLDATTTPCGHNCGQVDVTAASTSGLSAIPLTSSALQHVTGVTRSAPSSSSSMRAAAQDMGRLTAPSAGTVYTSTLAEKQRNATSASVAWIAGGGVTSAQNTYLGIKKRMDTLQFEKSQLSQEAEELRTQLAEWRAAEPQRRAEMKAAVQVEVTELQCTIAKERRRAKLEGEKAEKAQEALTQKVDALNVQLRAEAAARSEEVRRIEAANATAMSQLKSKWAAQEKVNRERWRLAEAKRIKESTLQSLEPDIVLLLNRHKAEKARLREDYENELRVRDEAIAAKDADVEALKSKLRTEAAETLHREQEAVQEHLRAETAHLQRQMEEERHRAQRCREQVEHHHDDEKRTLQREVDRLGTEVCRLQRAQTTEQASFHEAVTAEVQRITADANARMSALKEKLALEYAAREKEIQAANATHLRDAESELRARCERERDAAVARVVQRLESEHLRTMESARGSDGLLRERHLQLTREKERLQVELDLTREQLRAALEAHKVTSEEVQRMTETADLSASHVRAIEDRIRAEYAKRMDILNQEWQKKLHEFEALHVREVWTLQQQQSVVADEVSRLRSESEMEKKAMEQRHNTELSQINERVLVAMTKKENTIQYQSEQLLALQEAVNVRDLELQRHQQLLRDY